MFNCNMFPDGKGIKDTRSKCPKCGVPNKCGVEAGKGTCWCFMYPKVEMDRNEDTCLCETCLKEHIKETT